MGSIKFTGLTTREQEEKCNCILINHVILVQQHGPLQIRKLTQSVIGRIREHGHKFWTVPRRSVRLSIVFLLSRRGNIFKIPKRFEIHPRGLADLTDIHHFWDTSPKSVEVVCWKSAAYLSVAECISGCSEKFEGFPRNLKQNFNSCKINEDVDSCSTRLCRISTSRCSHRLKHGKTIGP